MLSSLDTAIPETGLNIYFQCVASMRQCAHSRLIHIGVIRMIATSRKAAKVLNLAKYRGAACSAGHNGIRYTATMECVQCKAEREALAARKATRKAARVATQCSIDAVSGKDDATMTEWHALRRHIQRTVFAEL